MRKYILFTFSILACLHVSAQGGNISIKGEVTDNIQLKTCSLMRHAPSGDILYCKGTVSADGKHFHFSLPSQIAPGVYGIKTEPFINNLEIIVDGKEKDIAFTIRRNTDETTNPVCFTVSEENKAWNDYTFRTSLLLKQMFSVKGIAKNTADEAIKANLNTSAAIMQTQYEKGRNDFLINHRGTVAAMLIKNDPHQMEYYNMLDYPASEEIQNTYWNGIDTNNAVLMNSMCYQGLIYTYLMHYFVESQKKEKSQSYLLQEKLKQATDTILGHFSIERGFRSQIITYLESLYLGINRIEMLRYVHEKYIQSEQCADELPETEQSKILQKQIEGLKFTAPGQPATDFAIKGKDGVVRNLKDLPTDKVLVVFWNTACSHCAEQMPLLEKYLESRKDKTLTTIAVCITEDIKAYNEIIKSYPSMIHVKDTGGWKGKIINDYYVSGTPTFFLLDKNRNFIGTYYSWNAIEKTIVND
jgi:thiol-disulfide isomerase/thioredoxin